MLNEVQTLFNKKVACKIEFVVGGTTKVKSVSKKVILESSDRNAPKLQYI